jgi:hypothetical protein
MKICVASYISHGEIKLTNINHRLVDRCSSCRHFSSHPDIRNLSHRRDKWLDYNANKYFFDHLHDQEDQKGGPK